MLSMTGYGRATCEIEGRQLTIELKSVNHRFLDLSFRMPRTLMFLEEDARRLIGARLARGHVDVFMTYRNLRADAKSVTVDKALFSAYASALEGVSEFGLKDDRSLMSVVRLPDVLVVTEGEEDQTALKALMTETMTQALNGMVEMRAREGREMAADLKRYVDAVETRALEIERRYPETVDEYMRRLRTAVEELIGQQMDEERLLTEVAIMADRSAIAEEIVRLKSHILQIRECLDMEEPVGRKLDFIVQEMNREVNTISSKSQDVPITRLAVDCKAVIEKLREQLQNVE